MNDDGKLVSVTAAQMATYATVQKRREAFEQWIVESTTAIYGAPISLERIVSATGDEYKDLYVQISWQACQKFSPDTELAAMTRMFQASCDALGAIDEELEIDPDISGGAEPIIDAIKELKARIPAPSREQVLSPKFIAQIIQNVCELPGRNSPDDEPEAMLCTANELENCISRAEEKFNDDGKPILIAKDPS